MYTKKERIAKGLVGKKTLIDVETGEKFIIDFDDPESGCTMSMEEMLASMDLQIKHNQKGFSEFTEEEMRLYSQLFNEEDDDNI